jgi:hypothetical protein
MRDIDLMVLADRSSSVCRAYLTYLNSEGFRPKKILLIDFIAKSKRNDTLIRLFGKTSTIHLLRMYRWVAGKRNTDKKKWVELSRIMDSKFENSVNFFGEFNYSDYAGEVCQLVIDGFDDPALLDVVERSDIRTMLYTGGGIVRPRLLELSNKELIHIHPGVVPYVKGADGILWSALVRKKLGYSGFYMNPGIDTGDVLITKEYPIPVFDKSLLKEFSADDLYKALLFSYDAHMRAKTLILLLDNWKRTSNPLWDMSRQKQKEEGRIYFFMHPRLRSAVLESMCE